MEFSSFVQESISVTSEWLEVEAIARLLRESLARTETAQLIEQANQPTKSSAEVQEVFRIAAEGLGFQSERNGLFQDSVAGLRPDFYRPIGQTGIIIEVERGKTTTNNMDLLDFWKCHICANASYLFLFVPQVLRHSPGGRPKHEFKSVERRLSHFFTPENYSNVLGLCLFGY